MSFSGEQDTIKPIITRVPVISQDTSGKKPVVPVPQEKPDTASKVVKDTIVTPRQDTSVKTVIDTPTVQAPPVRQTDTLPRQTETVTRQTSPVGPEQPTAEVKDTVSEQITTREFSALPVYIRGVKKDFSDFRPETNGFEKVEPNAYRNPYLTIADSTGAIKWRESIFSGHALQVNKFQYEPHEAAPRWVFPSLVLVLILFTIVKRLHLKKFSQFATAVFAERIYIQIVREETGILSPVTLLLGFGSMILWSLFIFQAAEHFHVLPEVPAVELLLRIVAGMLAFFIGKLFLYVISGIILNQIQPISRYLFTIVLFFSLGGILLFPFVLGYEFVKVVPEVSMIYAGLALAAVLFVFRTQRGFVLASDYGGLSKLYLFLYFCALEIVPLFLLFKAIEANI